MWVATAASRLNIIICFAHISESSITVLKAAKTAAEQNEEIFSRLSRITRKLIDPAGLFGSRAAQINYVRCEFIDHLMIVIFLSI